VIFFLIGWVRRFSVLGIKVDECEACGEIGPHTLGRKVWWGTLFHIPLLFLRFQHGMVCANCGAWSGIRFDRMWRGLWSGRLPLGRPREHFIALPPDEHGVTADVAAVMDPIQVPVKRDGWDIYLRVWPFIVAVWIIAVVLLSPHTSLGSSFDRDLQSRYGEAHDCWVDGGGLIAGCRLDSGVMDGSTSAVRTVCYFNEPLDEATNTFHCNP
jgi:hypothetical protein